MNYQSIKIGARTYKIMIVVNELFEQLLAERNVSENEFCDIKSFIDYDSQVIAIRSILSKEHQRELLIHELLHAWIDDSGIVQDEHAERFISVLAPRINDSVEQLFQLLT